MKPLKDLIRHQFIPAISGKNTITEGRKEHNYIFRFQSDMVAWAHLSELDLFTAAITISDFCLFCRSSVEPAAGAGSRPGTKAY